MKKIMLQHIFKDERGSIDTIFVGKSWGEINKFTSEKGVVRGNHFHKKTEELIFILEGKADVHIKNVKNNETQDVILHVNEGILIEPFELHTIKIPEKTVWIGCLTIPYDKENPDIYKE